MSRRKKLKTPDWLMLVGIAGGSLYLILKYVFGVSGTAAGYPSIALGALLLGVVLRPIAVRARNRILRRLGVRVVSAKGRRP